MLFYLFILRLFQSVGVPAADHCRIFLRQSVFYYYVEFLGKADYVLLLYFIGKKSLMLKKVFFGQLLKCEMTMIDLRSWKNIESSSTRWSSSSLAIWKS